MQEKTIIKLALVVIAFFILLNISLLAIQYDFSNLGAQGIEYILSDAPVLSYALIASIILLVLAVAWMITYQPPTDIYQKFRNIDSNALDADSKLRQTFYTMAIRYHAKFGTNKYHRYIVKHYNFFYAFHNDALRWIDKFSKTIPSNLNPQGLMLSVIASGRIGAVVTNINYVTGLPGNDLRADESIILYRHGDTIEVWSYNSVKPVFSFRKNTTKIQNTRRESDYISAHIVSIDQSGKTRYQFEIRFMCNDMVTSKWDDFIAIDKLNEVKAWTRESSQSDIELVEEQGIVVVDHSSDEPVYNRHSPLIRSLQKIQGQGKRIQAFFDINASSVMDKNSVIDIVALCRDIGIIAISERYENGDITYSGESSWYQTKDDETFEIDNVSLQAKYAHHTLSNILSQSNLKRWPIYSLVVYSSRDVTLTMLAGQQQPQCHVIKLEKFDKWIAKHLRDNKISFSESDILMFDSTFNAKQSFNPELSIE